MPLPVLDVSPAAAALAAGHAAVRPNPSPLTYVVAGTVPEAVNLAKGRPAGQEVALWVHDDGVWAGLAPALGLTPGAPATAFTLLRSERVTLLVPVRSGVPVPEWAAPASRDGHLLLFGARWEPLVPLLERLPHLYVSSANRTGHAPAATAAQAVAMFGPGVPVTDGDALRSPSLPHAATTMLRIAPGGDLAHVRPGAQDAVDGGADAYLDRLRAALVRQGRPPPREWRRAFGVSCPNHTPGPLARRPSHATATPRPRGRRERPSAPHADRPARSGQPAVVRTVRQARRRKGAFRLGASRRASGEAERRMSIPVRELVLTGAARFSFSHPGSHS